MRRKLVAGNWKKHGSLAENQALLGALKAALNGLQGAGVAVCAPFPYLAQLQAELKGNRNPSRRRAPACRSATLPNVRRRRRRWRLCRRRRRTGSCARGRSRARSSRMPWRAAPVASNRVSRRSRSTSRRRPGATCVRPCRRSAAVAGIDPAALSAEAQSMLPLIAGQLLREAVVGLNDLLQSRAKAPATAAASTAQTTGSANPLRTSASVEQALTRLLESHGRLYGGPVESLRDVLQEAKDHEAATQAAMQAGLASVLGQLSSPTYVADQFEQGRYRVRLSAELGDDDTPVC